MIRYKRPTVQLTSLLDLLFLMIFISLIQAKSIPEPKLAVPAPPKDIPVAEEKSPEKPVTQPAPRPKKVSVNAVFSFYPVDRNPNIANGSYEMRGQFNQETGALELGGVGWIDRPENYDMVPLKGKMNPERDQFTGKIQFYGCKQFTLKRVSPGNQGISGSWKGSYNCLQGDTGLTLTIE